MDVTDSAGLALQSLQTDAVEILTGPPRLRVLQNIGGAAGGTASAVSATWTECDTGLGTGYGWVKTDLPAPASAAVTLDVAQITADAAGPAGLAGIATVATVTSVVMTYADGSTKDLKADARTTFDADAQDPQDLISMDGLNVVPTGNGTGTATLLVTFSQAPAIQATVDVTVVSHTQLVITSNPFPTYVGSTDFSELTLSRIEQTGTWQRAQLSASLQLSDTTAVDVSATASFASASPDVVAVAGRIASVPAPPAQVDVAAITATLGTATSAAINLTATPDSVACTALSASLPVTTLSGITAVATAQLSVAATLDDTTQLPNALAVAGLLELETRATTGEPPADLSAKASVNAAGLVTLLENHHRMVRVAARAVTSQVEGWADIYCNLTPAVGDVDLGETSQAPHPDREPGEAFTMPVRVNTGGATLGTLEVKVLYDTALVKATGVTKGADWPGGQFDSEIDNVGDAGGIGFVRIVGVTGVATTASGAALRAADIQFTANAAVKTETLISGQVLQLTDNAGSNTPIPSDAVFPADIVAGAGLLDPDCGAGNPQPKDIPGNTNGDCKLDALDVKFTLEYDVGKHNPNDLLPFQLTALDTDGNGAIEPADALYLLRVFVNKWRFAKLAITAPQGLGGALTLRATLVDRFNKPASANTTVRFELGTTANPSLSFTTGTDAASTANGQVVTAVQDPLKPGDYVAVATGFTAAEADIGVVLIITTTDTGGDTAVDRKVALFGTPLVSGTAFDPYDKFSVAAGTDGQPCTTAAHCEAALFCVDGTCKSGQPLGADCTDAALCLSGNCVDGVCCAGACTGCASCALAGNKGRCTPKQAGCVYTTPTADIDGSGTLDAADLACLARVLDPADATTCAQTSTDLNCDGEVTADDLDRLRQLLTPFHGTQADTDGDGILNGCEPQ